ncbi:acyl-CoA dehydrogenase [Desulfosarcina widdelii]|uniref:Acyl-CoA dehydrogenase n=1 Tax=Desulfosarcina widdelii TaxID=947919 RepID=A0A5K7Z3L1_9BACT|nr:acyl-CoA dehydrogenase [Desulfosarcina widdelii]BBO75568.1 acyl-CoA dehydrogenase [Desulfosarcina widdelii]
METKFLSETNLKFLLHDVHEISALTEYDAYRHQNRKMFDMVMGAALDLAKTKLYPILEEMDENIPELLDGSVRVHSAVRNLMKEYGEGGWIGASFPEQYGGEQLPLAVAMATRYIFAAANYSASTFPELTAGAAHLIISFGSEDMVAAYVPNMLSGKWQGTMALTEPEAGSSLADITASASPAGDGSYRIKGQKIFISGGDHDGVDNVVHLMLAKIDGAPAGVKGISLFVVPKKRIDPAGALVGNDIVVSQVFHKLGYRGNPITQLSIGENGDCHGFLLGEPHKGLAYMFQMMNEARLGVGMGAAAIASAAYYAALEYTRGRTQGRKIGQKNLADPQVPIIEHADVKRMLLFQRSVVEGSLSLLLQCSMYADLAHLQDGEDKTKHALLLDLLTPVAKSYPSEMGILTTSQAIQCLGGYGYCKDFPVEQYYRDVRIHPIHEGTTGIQGMDLLGRKVTMHGGESFNLFNKEVGSTIAHARRSPELAASADQLEASLIELQNVTRHKIEQAATSGPEVFLADATLYLEYFGIIVIAWQWLKQAIVAQSQLEKASRIRRSFLTGKMFTFRYFFAYELPKTKGLRSRLLDTDPLTVRMESSFFND